MWEIDLKYRTEFESIFNRLLEKRDLLKKSRPLPAIALEKIKDALSIEWTYNSNSIEGNSMTLRETFIVLKDGMTVKGKPLREHFEINNHHKALHFLYKLVEEKKELNCSNILDIHGFMLNNIEDLYAGRLRNAGVRIQGANFVPPNARKVSGLLDELIDFIIKNPLQLNSIELATVFHHKFVWIHPFFDGNGRTVRLVMNLILMNTGFPPAIILRNDRNKYYSALNLANNGNYGKLMLLMCQALERSLNIYLNALPDSDSNYTEISNIVEEPDIPYGQEYISLLARKGKIDAYKEGKNWLTTKEAVLDYIKNRKNIPIFKLFNDFKSQEILAYYKDNLEETEPEFANTIQEYRDGLLLFELMQQKIWNKSSKDTLGLQDYFNTNTSKYKTKELKKVKGKVMNDYQNFLETNWIANLRKKSKIKVNKKVLKKLIAFYEKK